jgi:hypothetical protein
MPPGLSGSTAWLAKAHSLPFHSERQALVGMSPDSFDEVVEGRWKRGGGNRGGGSLRVSVKW